MLICNVFLVYCVGFLFDCHTFGFTKRISFKVAGDYVKTFFPRYLPGFAGCLRELFLWLIC